jgi:hypothetical protein
MEKESVYLGLGWMCKFSEYKLSIPETEEALVCMLGVTLP